MQQLAVLCIKRSRALDSLRFPRDFRDLRIQQPALHILKKLNRRRTQEVSFRSSESQQKPYKCIICCIRFKHEKSLHAHRQKEHSIVRRFKCLKCDQNFETMKSLREHAWMTNHRKEGVNFGSDFKVRRTLPIRFSPNEVLAFVAKKADKEMSQLTKNRSTNEVSGLVNIGSPSSRDTVPQKIHMVL